MGWASRLNDGSGKAELNPRTKKLKFERRASGYVAVENKVWDKDEKKSVFNGYRLERKSNYINPSIS